MVGVIENTGQGDFCFYYLNEGIEEAQKEGFTPYIDFPDTTRTYKDNVLDVFGQRLIKFDRTDVQKYLDFWEVLPEDKEDKYKLLAFTQAMLPTDNFEFLADFYPVKGLHFVSEVCGLSGLQFKSDFIIKDDILTWQLEKDNPFDPFAVKVYKGNDFIGYIKLVHSKIFHEKPDSDFKIQVKNVDQNGIINRIFIRISLS